MPWLRSQQGEKVPTRVAFSQENSEIGTIWSEKATKCGGASIPNSYVRDSDSDWSSIERMFLGHDVNVDANRTHRATRLPADSGSQDRHPFAS